MALTQIVVAAVDLPYGTALAPDQQPAQLRLVSWPQESVPAGAFANLEAIFKNAKSSNDRVVLTAMVAGEPVLTSKVSGFGTRPIMSSQVADGMRAISIHIDDVSGVSGFILPGDHVDIMLTHHVGTGNDNLVTDVIMQGIKVLGIDQLSDLKTDKPVVGHTATVEVPPDQAQKLVLAQQAGTLSLALRNPETAVGVTASRVAEGDLSTGHRIVRSSGHTGSAVRVRYGNGDVVTRTTTQ
jgi:pilus assembly protein CpaB